MQLIFILCLLGYAELQPLGFWSVLCQDFAGQAQLKIAYDFAGKLYDAGYRKPDQDLKLSEGSAKIGPATHISPNGVFYKYDPGVWYAWHVEGYWLESFMDADFYKALRNIKEQK